MYIYKTTNLINGKIYIGKRAKSPSLSEMYIGSGKLLKLAIKKYGIENFFKTIIEECPDNETLNCREKYWIDNLSAYKKSIGYNIAKGGNGGDVYTNHPNKKLISERLSASKMGHIVTEETRKKISIANKGRKRIAWNKGLKGIYSEEIIKKMRERMLGKPSIMKGKTMSEESRMKMRLAKLGKPSNRYINKNKEVTQ